MGWLVILVEEGEIVMNDTERITFETIIAKPTTTNTYRLLMELRELKNLGYYYLFCSTYNFNLCKLIRHVKYLDEMGFTYDRIKDDIINR